MARKALLCLLLTLALTGTFANSSRSQESKTVVRMGTPPLAIWMLPIQVAEAKGFFAAEGLDVKINYMRGGSEAAAALIGNDIDVLCGAVSHTLVLRSKGLPIKALVGVAGIRDFALVVDAKRHANVTSIKQMKGFKIATSRRGSDGDQITRMLLKEAGLSPSTDVSLIQIGGYQNHLTAIEQGEVDGSMILEPFLTVGVRKGIIKPVVDFLNGQGPDSLRKRIWTDLAATDDYIKANPKVAEHLVRAIARAVSFIDNDVDGASAIAQKYFPSMDPETLHEIVQRHAKSPRGHGYETTISPEAIGLENKYLLSQQSIPKALKYDDVVDTAMEPYWTVSR